MRAALVPLGFIVVAGCSKESVSPAKVGPPIPSKPTTANERPIAPAVFEGLPVYPGSSETGRGEISGSKSLMVTTTDSIEEVERYYRKQVGDRVQVTNAGVNGTAFTSLDPKKPFTIRIKSTADGRVSVQYLCSPPGG